jgi:[ribosomal protein S5]-alanine N-acetyltransferase
MACSQIAQHCQQLLVMSFIDKHLSLPIVTPRLHIRECVRTDMRIWSALFRSKKARKYLNGPLKQSAQQWWDDQQRNLGKADRVLTIASCESNEVVGVCGFFAAKEPHVCETWLMLRTKFWRKSVGAEVTSALVNFAFTSLAIKRVIGIIDPTNQVSLKMITKLGFSFVMEHSESGSWQHGHHVYAVEPHTYIKK